MPSKLLIHLVSLCPILSCRTFKLGSPLPSPLIYLHHLRFSKSHESRVTFPISQVVLLSFLISLQHQKFVCSEGRPSRNEDLSLRAGRRKFVIDYGRKVELEKRNFEGLLSRLAIEMRRKTKHVHSRKYQSQGTIKTILKADASAHINSNEGKNSL